MAGPAKEHTKHTKATDIVVAKRGDVLLELSKDGKPAGTLLVLAQVLSLASPVFEAMFNGNFAEGQVLSAASPKRVALPDDDAEAITLLCKLTHMHHAGIPDNVSYDKLADFAVVCDKYQCTEAVRYWTKVQVNHLMATPNHFSFEKLIFVAYILDLPHLFQQVCLRLIRERVGTFRYHIATHGTDIIPLQILGECHLLHCNSQKTGISYGNLTDRYKDHIRDVQNTTVFAVRNAFLPKKFSDLATSDCGRAAEMLKAYIAGLAQAEMPMGKLLSLKDYAERAVKFQAQSMDYSCTEHHDCAVTKGKNIKQEVAAELINGHVAVKAPCLDCLRNKFCGMKLTCRLGHTIPKPIPRLDGNTVL
jgi:hypothetical protein